MKEHYYNILGIQAGASKKEIKSAYKRLAKQYHPDVNPHPDAGNKFLAISEAYEALMHPVKFEIGRGSYSYKTAPKRDVHAAWREKKKKQEAKKREEMQRFYLSFYRVCNPIVGIYIVLNVFLALDFLLPPKENVEHLKASAESYESVGRYSRRHAYDILYFENHEIRVNKGEVKLEPLEARIYSSRLLGIVKGADIKSQYNDSYVEPAYGLFNIFVYLIPIVFILGFAYYRIPVTNEHKAGVAVSLLFLGVIQLIVYLVS